jgi:TonB family protein
MHNHRVAETQKLSDPKFRAQLWFDVAKSYIAFSSKQQPILALVFRNAELDDLSKAAKLDPDNPKFLASYGESCLIAGMLTKGVPVLERALKLHPNWAPVMYDLASAYAATKKTDKALQMYDRIVPVDAAFAKRAADVLQSYHIDINEPRNSSSAVSDANSGNAAGSGDPSSKEQLGKDYVAAVQKAIKQNMKPPFKISQRYDVGVIFRVATDGTISNIKIVASSGNTDIDDSAKMAIVVTAPLPTVPKGLLGQDNFVDIKMLLDYNPVRAGPTPTTSNSN